MKGYVIKCEEYYFAHSTAESNGMGFVVNFHGYEDPQYAAIYQYLSAASDVLSNLSKMFPSRRLTIEEIEV